MDILETQDTIKEEIGAINSKKIELNNSIKIFGNVEAEFEKIRDIVEQLMLEEKNHMLEAS